MTKLSILSDFEMFCLSISDTSRHLVEEDNDLKCGNKILETSCGLVNIVRDYCFTLFRKSYTNVSESCCRNSYIYYLHEYYSHVTSNLQNKFYILEHETRGKVIKAKTH
ncbi:CLUMA_CG006156, isoform A [Clunio marinus]|uniref:CLUMA_CG006156, isoform A n=1 Tax=Clunio marinus TaxID=568069 RepID=A0A1J1HZ42_9DIPT|nr:CLUMA_CG006156, isoform A [Clunio marinus]